MSSEARPMIYAQISRVMSDIGAVTKDRKNEQQKYFFRGIEDLYQAAHPALIRYGVFCAPEVLEREEFRFEKKNFDGKITAWLHVTMKIRHRFFAEDGSFIDVTTCGEGLDNSDKATNKAMSGAMKYALIELFCVPTKDVEDSDRESPETGTRRGNTGRTTEDVPLQRSGAARNVAEAVRGTAQAPGNPPTVEVEPGELGAPPVPKVFVDELRKQVTEPSMVGFTTKGQQVNFARAWNDACPSSLTVKQKDLLRHDWLAKSGYLDEQNLPTSAKIPATDYEAVKRDAISFARKLGENDPITDADIPF